MKVQGYHSQVSIILFVLILAGTDLWEEASFEVFHLLRWTKMFRCKPSSNGLLEWQRNSLHKTEIRRRKFVACKEKGKGGWVPIWGSNDHFPDRRILTSGERTIPPPPPQQIVCTQENGNGRNFNLKLIYSHVIASHIFVSNGFGSFGSKPYCKKMGPLLSKVEILLDFLANALR